MKPKEKANYLVNKMFNELEDSDAIAYAIAKSCVLIAVDEIQRLPNIGYNHSQDESQYDYWQEVKQEIESIKN